MLYNYSIIIPYYDKYSLFIKAFESIPDRSDIQIIIVDNSPHSLSSEQVPTKQFSKVCYTTSSKTKGAGCARNVGLQHVEGRFILFLDADDYFTTDAFSAFDRYKDKEYDIVFFDADSINLSNGLRDTRHKTIHNLLHTYLTTGNEDYLRYKFVNPISKMFRTDFVLGNAFRFDEIPVSNDVWFSVSTGHKAQIIAADVTVVYMITAGEIGTSLTKKRTKENWFIRYKVQVKVNKFLKSVGKYKYRIRLIGALRIALNEFGVKESLHFLKYALENRIGIF